MDQSYPDLCEMGGKSGPRASKIDPGGSKIDPGGSKIDPGASPERPKAEKSGQKCTESFPRASRERFVYFWGAKRAILGVQTGGFFSKNRSKGRSGSENGDFSKIVFPCTREHDF